MELLSTLTKYSRFSAASECGQTATEYLAITVVGVVLALTINYILLRGALDAVVTNIADRLEQFVTLAS